MDWFERLVGFREISYADTRSRLRINGSTLRSSGNEREYEAGTFETPSLAELRQRAPLKQCTPCETSIKSIAADVRDLHRSAENSDALFMVASQANCLEMVGPDVSPEDGITRYEHDLTQGPACAIAAGAATVFRNFFVPIGSEIGQTRDRQLNLFVDLGQALSRDLKQPVAALWQVRNGYLLASRAGLEMISAHFMQLTEAELDQLRALVRIGLHWDVQVTDTTKAPPQYVSQASCSALPVAYSSHPTLLWAPLARLVLDAFYEATLLAGVLNHGRGRSNVVYLTHLGGGAFGNPRVWIDDALHRALSLASGYDLDLRIVSRRGES
jgi:hypothetical protein